MSSFLNTKLSLKTNNDIIEAVEHFNSCVQQSAWISTNDIITVYSQTIREIIAKKRKTKKTKLDYVISQIKLIHNLILLISIIRH